ncbi:MAG: hypothetical protein ACK4ND_07415 [Cytophagaceae bacterium]
MEKKSTPIFSVLLFLLLAGGCSEHKADAQEELFVQIPEIPEDIDHREIYTKIYKELRKDIPKKTSMDIPSYPGAVVFSVNKSDNEDVLPGITIMSDDDPEKVIKFYKTHGYNVSIF